jgi:hypothetical protein
MQTKRVALNPTTGLYYSGTAFDAPTIDAADSGEITRAQAAAEYVRTQRRAGQKSFTVRIDRNKWVSRFVINSDTSEPYIRLGGNEVAVIWSQGELATHAAL